MDLRFCWYWQGWVDWDCICVAFWLKLLVSSGAFGGQWRGNKTNRGVLGSMTWIHERIREVSRSNIWGCFASMLWKCPVRVKREKSLLVGGNFHRW